MQYFGENVSDRVGIVLVIVSSIAFAFVPNSAKIALDDGTSLFLLVLSRYAIGAVFLMPIMFVTKQNIKMPLNKIPLIIIPSLSSFLLIALTYHAVDYLDVGLVLLILYCFPLGVAAISHFRGKEKISGIKFLLMFVVLLGLGLMLFDGRENISGYGLLISFIGLVCFVVFISSSAELSKDLGSMTFNLYLSFFGMFFLILIFFMPFGVEVLIPNSFPGHIAIVANGFFYIVSWVLFFEGARIIGANRSSLLACTEPLFAALLAIFLVNQMLSPIEWIGFFVVLSSIYLFEKKSMT